MFLKSSGRVAAFREKNRDHPLSPQNSETNPLAPRRFSRSGRNLSMRPEMRSARPLTALLLVVATVAVYATEWLAFLWPVIALVDAGAALSWRKTRARV